MASKKSKTEKMEPLASLKRFVKACRKVEAENALTAGEILFGYAVREDGVRFKSQTATALDALLGELKDWEP
jgi:hypothetical protein